MNLGYLNGMFSDYKIIGTQMGICQWQIYFSNIFGTFLAPPEAEYALISGCASGQSGTSLVVEEEPDIYYGATAGGGAGAACFRVPFDLSVYRYVPYYSATDGVLTIGAKGGTDLTGGPIYGGMPSVVLNPGAMPLTQAVGGNGGGATYQYCNSNTSNIAITADGGGSSGAHGKVIGLSHGGIIAGGGAGGGGNNGDPPGGSVATPFGIRRGGRQYFSGDYYIGGGGASFFADGISGFYNYASGAFYSSNVKGIRGTFDASFNGYQFGVPGAGLPGRNIAANSPPEEINTLKHISSRYLICEFIAPRRN